MISELFGTNMFFIDNFSSLMSTRSVFYSNTTLAEELLGFAFTLIEIHNLDTDKKELLALDATVSSHDILDFLKKTFDKKSKNARFLVPSLWLHNSEHGGYFSFPEGHNMKTLIEATPDFEKFWKVPVQDLGCRVYDQVQVCFEKYRGSSAFNRSSGIPIGFGMTCAAFDKYGKWYHGQIVQVRNNGNGEECLIHWIGFKETWREWVRQDEGKILSIQDAKKEKLRVEFKWHPKSRKKSSIKSKCVQNSRTEA